MTKLLYFDDMCRLTDKARVLEIWQESESPLITLVLDQTVFYPQGGGQPSDKGIMRSEQTTFDVQHVAMHDNAVLHKGIVNQGPLFTIGDTVALQVNAELRHLHNRNHTGGHIIDCALAQLGYNFTPHKAYHFPKVRMLNITAPSSKQSVSSSKRAWNSLQTALCKQIPL